MVDRMPDSQLIVEFTHAQSSEAFAAIVQRYVNLVYGTARRMVGDIHEAEDVTQAAFIVLIRKAQTIDPSTLPGWLVNTTRLVAKEAIRSKHRRRRHEIRVAQMKGETERSTFEPTIEELTPMLDDALSRLNASDRTAVVTRFLQGLSFADVGMTMGVSEEAARKRVARAVEKRRTIFMKQGIAPSTGGLMVTLAAQQASRAPAMLAKSVSAACAAGGTGQSLAMVKGAMSAMTLAKLKTAAVILLLLMVTGGLGVGVQSLRRAMADEPAASSAPAAQVNSIDLLKRYPTQLTQGDDVPEHARSWDFTTADIFRVSRFGLNVGNDLRVELGPADLGIGHCGDGAVWALFIPRDGGTVGSRINNQEAIASIWLRFHPGEIDRLIPPDTVFADGAGALVGPMRMIARVKMISSWQAGGKAMIPEPKDLIVDVDVKAGVRRFFVVDRQARTARYMAVFEKRPVMALSPKHKEDSSTDGNDSPSIEFGATVLFGGVFCLLTVVGVVVNQRHQARSRSGKS